MSHVFVYCRVPVKVEMGLRLQNSAMVDVLLLVFQGVLRNIVGLSSMQYQRRQHNMMS